MFLSSFLKQPGKTQRRLLRRLVSKARQTDGTRARIRRNCPRRGCRRSISGEGFADRIPAHAAVRRTHARRRTGCALAGSRAVLRRVERDDLGRARRACLLRHARVKSAVLAGRHRELPPADSRSGYPFSADTCPFRGGSRMIARTWAPASVKSVPSSLNRVRHSRSPGARSTIAWGSSRTGRRRWRPSRTTP